ncbi:hypothetical protein [Pseudomonas sp. DWRC2-2]|uniref:hypothetical protein n=1 Tax=Pseudomonas sp. DWRC2-2 TaxID=2804567 RepID=UPI003CEE3715
MKTSVELDHPVLFILDYSNEHIEIPEFNEKTGINHSPSCVSVGAISYADGKVAVSLYKRKEHNHDPAKMKKIISTEILTPSKKISVTNAENSKLLEIDSPDTSTTITVYTDSSPYAENVIILIG